MESSDEIDTKTWPRILAWFMLGVCSSRISFVCSTNIFSAMIATIVTAVELCVFSSSADVTCEDLAAVARLPS